MDSSLHQGLNQLLHDLTVAQRNVHILHWNLKADDFYVLHPYLGDLYNTIFEFVDETAEQIRFQEAFPAGTLQEASDGTRLKAIESNHFYSHDEAIEIALSIFKYLKALTNNIVSYADSQQLWDVVQVFSDHEVKYSKIIYFLQNSLTH